MTVGYVCPYCGEGLPEDEACPCQAIDDDVPHDRRLGRSARRAQDRRRRDRMQTAGPVESFTVAEIGDRDGWVCGICQDMARLVDASPGAARALSPSIDHVIAVSDGGPHVRANVRIAHLWCNVERNNSKLLTPEYMRAQLSSLLDGTPVPEELHRSFSPSWRWPASLRVEYMIAVYIAAGRVAADSRYGDPATRLADIACQRFGDTAQEAIRDGLDWADRTSRRRSGINERWRSPR